MYRKTYSKECVGPADTWKSKMKARIKESFVYRCFKSVLENWIGILIIIILAPLIWMIFGLVVAQFRDPYPSDCKIRCEKIEAYEYNVEYGYVNPFIAKRSESKCLCRFENGLISEQSENEWEKIK